MTDFATTKAMFHLPEGMIYLDGNSLGPLPRHAAARIGQTVSDEWGDMLITGWNKAGWMAQPTVLADRIGKLIGAEAGHVVLGDTLSIKVYQALAAALDQCGNRKVILSDTGNFPTDLYMAQGLIASLDQGHELRTVAPDAIMDALGDDVGVLMLTQVDYRTGRMHDMATITAAAQAHGIITIWDLAHSAGAIPVDLAACNVDFAVGCTYKYLNGGPGAPAFIYVSPKCINATRPTLSGWLGHAAPFAFDPTYQAGTGIERMRVGTPPVIQMAALDAAMDIWDKVDIIALRAASLAFSEILISEVTTRCPDLRLASPPDGSMRGSQVSFHHPEGYAIVQALIAQGVIGDFRAPDIIRFGITPLYLDEADIRRAADILCDIMTNRTWDQPQFKIRAAVT
ncbi:MAG: kynureninase [Yoonia sp.]